MPVSRQVSSEAGALLLAGAPGRSLNCPAPAGGAQRSSRITRGTVLVHADLHNHTLLSDGSGDPAAAFPSMRDAGLDVAALTDHAIRGASIDAPEPGWSSMIGLDRAGWRRIGELAAAHDQPGEFIAIRGFEWSHPHLGHVNAWFTDDFTDTLNDPTIPELYEWLRRAGRETGAAGIGGPGLAGFNHPGREGGCFDGFGYADAAAEQLVSLEMFNRTDDYLFEGVARGGTSPLVSCLEAGWRTGLLGVSDEHGDDWGFPDGKGRAGLWVSELSRFGVAQAMRARRFFATRVCGLRVDATANGVRMGSALRHRSGVVDFALDVDCGSGWVGIPLQVQLLRPGHPVPAVAEVLDIRCGEVARFGVPLDLVDGGWVVLRVADPAAPNGTPGPSGHPANALAVAYTSPWFLEP